MTTPRRATMAGGRAACFIPASLIPSLALASRLEGAGVHPGGPTLGNGSCLTLELFLSGSRPVSVTQPSFCGARKDRRRRMEMPNGRPDPHHLRLGSRDAAGLCA